MTADFYSSNATTQANSPQEKIITPSGYSHSFDTGIASQLGLNCAVIFNHIVYWLKINMHKGHNQINGKTWMYETASQMSDFFGYFTERQVRHAINSLVENNILIEGNFNKNKFDKTTWYALVDESILGKSKKDFEVTSVSHPLTSVSHPENIRVTCSIQQENKKNTQEEQQQAAVFFACLEDLDLTDAVKERLCKFPEEEVNRAVLWATHPEVEIKTTLAQAITWAIKEKPEIPKNKHELEEENRNLAKSYEGKISSQFAGYHCGPHQVEIYPLAGMNLPKCISYKETLFKETLVEELRKQKFYYNLE